VSVGKGNNGVCRRGANAATSSGDGGGFLSCLLCKVMCVGKGFWT